MLRLWALSVGVIIAVTAGASAQQSPVERGGYLVNGVGVCGNCHSPRGGDAKSFGGGSNVFNTPNYTVKGSNLTNHREAGIGKYSDAEFKTVFTTGKRPSGTQLAPNMPYNLYGILTARDQDAILAYLRSLPEVATPVDPPQYKAEIAPLQPYPPAAKQMTDADLNDPVKRGLYLASLGHCVACHSKPSGNGVDYVNGLGGGGRKFGPQQITAANITPKGLGHWTDAELKAMLTTGVSRDGRKLNAPMADFPAFYKSISDDDLGAIIAWMRSLPPLD
ncbi:MAG: hypothetical protein QOC56_998 [Alphaproteobacteria bacterium]|nr:hypothetical protein [Alphaproteobacteria bacterium]